MEQKLRRYVEGLFEGTAPTRKAVELKEEMIQNLEDKYKDLLSEGKTPEAAYNVAVAGIGDVTALLKEMERGATEMPNEAARQKSAMLTAIAVMMYIVSVLPIIVLSILRVPNGVIFGITSLFLFVAGATGILIYNSMSKPKYLKEDDTMIEEFREWQTSTKEERDMRRAISSALWAVIVTTYIIVSFWTFAWHITWVIFLLGGAIESILNIFLSRKK